jgi:hypothetical protein
MALATSALRPRWKGCGWFLEGGGQAEPQNPEKRARNGMNIYRPFPAVSVNRSAHLPVTQAGPINR